MITKRLGNFSKQSVDNDEKVVNNVYTLGGKQKCWFLTEYGLYEVLMQSRKPVAKEFKKGVKKILKEIRQQGFYATSEVRNNVNSDYVESLMDLLQFKDSQIEFKDNLIDTLNNRVDHLLTLLEKYYHPEKQTKEMLPIQSGEVRILGKSELMGSPVTVFGTPDNPLFYAKEIAKVFGVVSSIRMTHYVSEGNKKRLRNPTCIFGGQRTWFINKEGLKELAYRYAYCGGVVDAEKFDNDIHNLLQTIHSK